MPPLTQASTLAGEVRAAVFSVDHHNDVLSDFGRVSLHGRLTISQETLSAAAGQDEALLVPLAGDRFAICVDPTPNGGWSRIRPAMRRDLRRHRHRFRVAHEIAHTFFYDRRGNRPRRLIAGSEHE